MALFFFDLADGEMISRDDSGYDLLDVSSAREKARVLANAKIEHVKSAEQPYDNREFHVRVKTGKCVAKIAFRYVTA